LSLGGIVLIAALGTLVVSRQAKRRQTSREGEQP